jgi:hypothetical protein
MVADGVCRCIYFLPYFYPAVAISLAIYLVYRTDQAIQLGVSWRSIALALIVLTFVVMSSVIRI